MYKKKPFIVFEGIEGSGKSIHSKNLVNFLKKKKIPYIYLREPGGTKKAEIIRKLILNKNNKKINILTDTLLYLAARNENFTNNIKPYYKKKVIICDRFIDSTLAYQHYGLGISKNLIQIINNSILKNVLPDFTFLMKTTPKESIIRLTKRKKLNRYDKFKKSFYSKVQSGFIKIAKKNSKKYMIIDSNKYIIENKLKILLKFKKLLKYYE
tara:strand:- start:687 stop:1319 length:633 start_codon:yes stop_codon:yes gene_type:complete